MSNLWEQKILPLVLGAALVGAAGCGPDEASPRVQVSLFGWGPNGEGGQGFVTGLPDYPGAQTVTVKVTQPNDRRVLERSSFAFASRSASLPDITYGERIRLDVEVFDANNQLLAAGSTPMFTFEPGSPLRSFRAMVSPVGQAAPVGSLILDSESDQTRLVQSAFDYRGEDRSWLGRIGHESAATSEGEILIVGGGSPTGFYQPFTTPSLTEVYDDIQVFSPVTGYFTSLAQDDASEAVGMIGRDKLAEPRAFHTVTALGEDRYLVAGGFTLRDGVARPVDTLELIDLNEPPGTRVRSIIDFNGNPVRLNSPRAHHTATLRSSDGAVLIAGGIGREDQVLSTFEVVNVRAAEVSLPIDMSSPRVGHSAVLLHDGQTVWVAGGRTRSQVLDSSELLVPAGASSMSQPGVDLGRARYGASARRVRSGGGDLVLMVGGFTSLSEGASASYELGRPLQDQWIAMSEQRMESARGVAAMVELPQTGDLLIVGGLDPDRQVVTSAERLVFQGLSAIPPFAVEELGSLYQERYDFTADVASNGQVLITGGMSRENNNVARHDAEYFNAYDPVRPPL
ncbi:hypothetical protein [Lujinxingia litoralis]|uniref:hypothetical protein n=1 Tax=Lujinxingia litoralis TaxID=2211119 RepID=UPI0011B941FB|nr:hypothetical protein [Lujinxingia litoralis]